MKTRDLITNIVIWAMIKKGYFSLYTMSRNAKDARKKNDKLLFKILNANKTSEYGRKYHFSEIKSIDDFRQNVPITRFDAYEDYVNRMIENDEKNLITSVPLAGYAQSSGTMGKKKYIPLSYPEIKVYTDNTVTRALALADRASREVYKKGLKPGRGMFTCPALKDTLPNGLPCTYVPDVAAKQYGFVYPYILNAPFKTPFTEQEADTQYMNCRFALEDRDTLYVFCIFYKEIMAMIDYLKSNWRSLCDDIENGTLGDLAVTTPEAAEIIKSYLKPNPERANELRKEFEKGFDETIIKRIWPNMSLFSGIGNSSFEAFTERTRKYSKGVPFDFSIYGASEGLFAAADEIESTKQLLLIDSCYYEFIPVDDETKILSLDELEIGKEYEIVITNQAGFYRYRCGDIIKVVDYLNDCPYINFSSRKGTLLNITGEKTSEEQMVKAVEAVAKAAGIDIKDWAVYCSIDEFPYNYILLLEAEDGMDLRPFAEVAHEKLKEVNPQYAYFTSIVKIGPIEIENLEPGTHKAWVDLQMSRGTPFSQVKPVRIIDTDVKKDHFLNRIRKMDKNS